MAVHQAPPVPGILQARTLEWAAISFSNAWKVKVKSFSRVWLLGTPWTAAYQVPPSVEFSRQEYWSGVAIAFPARCMWFSTNPWRHSGFHRPQAGTWVHDLGFSPPICLPPLAYVSRITFNPPSNFPLFLLWPRVGDPLPSLLRWIQCRFNL